MAVTNEGMRTRLNRKIATYYRVGWIRSSLIGKCKRVTRIRTSKWYAKKNHEFQDWLFRRWVHLTSRLCDIMFENRSMRDALRARSMKCSQRSKVAFLVSRYIENLQAYIHDSEPEPEPETEPEEGLRQFMHDSDEEEQGGPHLI